MLGSNRGDDDVGVAGGVAGEKRLANLSINSAFDLWIEEGLSGLRASGGIGVSGGVELTSAVLDMIIQCSF